ncbi:uncharacterized protein LOC119677283 [Teleopsis dalmanni]|uniref:uncharacterized protein LOC119677283 n=1 Tax=Teleopsis dalmanni TaxID=139649 RepID=UPI0018CE4819|nr:uncharacterized protein LOC119677283 [Teleopsis dalmanni]
MHDEQDNASGMGLAGLCRPLGRRVGPYQKNIKVEQLNIHHSKAASAMMRHFDEEKLDILLIQEPWIVQNAIMGFGTSVATLFFPQAAGKIRTCIMVRKGIQCIQLPHLYSPDLTTVRVGSDANTFIVASAYLPYDSTEPPPSQEVIRLMEYCRTKRLEIVIGCDANAHNIVWGSSDSNNRGESLLEFVEKYNLMIVNRGLEPTFVDARRSEVIDLTLCSGAMTQKIEKWRVADRLTMSDHRAIHFEILCRPKRTNNQRLVRIPENTNQVTYLTLLTELLQNRPLRKLKTTWNVETEVKAITAAMINAFENACPQTSIAEKSSTPWWSQDLDVIKKETKKAFNKYMREKNSESWDLYKAKKREFKKALRNRKRESWRNFCSSMKGTSEVSRLQKMVTKDPVSRLGLIRKKDGTMTETVGESLSTLMEIHFPGSFKFDDH